MALHFILVDSDVLDGKEWSFAVEGEHTYFLRNRDVDEIVLDDETVAFLMNRQATAMLRAVS